MDMKEFSTVNLMRCIEGFNHKLDDWSPAEWTNAVAGEAGEACNIAKKMIRFRDSLKGNTKEEDRDYESLRNRMAKELADVFIYLDLAIQSLGFDTSEIIREVFNKKSEEIQCRIKMPPGQPIME